MSRIFQHTLRFRHCWSKQYAGRVPNMNLLYGLVLQELSVTQSRERPPGVWEVLGSSCRGLRFFLCPTLVTCWLFHLHNNRSNQQKSNFALAANLFLYISFPLFCTTTTWNFQKLPSCAFYGENVVRVLVHLFFSLLLILTLVAASISHFLTVAIKFSCYSSNKKCLVCFFISRSLRWPVSYFLVFSVFLFLYILNLWTWQLI